MSRLICGLTSFSPMMKVNSPGGRSAKMYRPDRRFPVAQKLAKLPDAQQKDVN
jgi:hypothetical protein